MKLDYKEGTIPFDSKDAHVKYVDSNGKSIWRKLNNSHYISTFYNYFEELIVAHEDDLREQSSQKVSKIINPDNQRIVNHIKEYDDRSTFFRYVDLSKVKQEAKEAEKKYNKKIALEDFNPDVEKPSTVLFVVNNTDEIIEIHQKTTTKPLRDLSIE